MAKYEPEDALPWQEELAAKTGASPQFIFKLATAYASAPLDALDAPTWVYWLLDQLDPSNSEADIFLRPDSMIRVFGRAITNQADEASARSVAHKGIRLAVEAWFAGKTLCELEKVISDFVAANEGTVKRKTLADPKAKRARRFVLRIASDIAFLCGVLSQISQKLAAEVDASPPPMVGFLPQLTRHGLETPYHFALSRDGEEASRSVIREAFARLESEIQRLPTDDWNAVRTKLENAQVKAMFSIDDDDVQALLLAIQNKKD